MKYLITGGCGFVGTNLTETAIKNNNEVFILDNLSRNGSLNNLNFLKSIGPFNFINGNVADFELMKNLIKTHQPDFVFHLAGQVAMTSSISNPMHDFQTNALGTLNILESVRLYSPSTIIVYSSTNKVYGDFKNITFQENNTRYFSPNFPNGFNEDLPLDFHSPYGCSKGSADQYLLDYYRIYGIRTIVLRHSSMYGGNQFSTENQGWIGWFIQKALEIKNNIIKGESFTISGNGKQVRDVLYSSDVVDCYYSIIKNINITKGQVYNIGGGYKNSLSLIELFKFLENELSIRISYKNLPSRSSDQLVFIADNSKISKAINWSPKVNYKDGIRKTIKWINENLP
jgi:CDP-paratose 2-epimerase